MENLKEVENKEYHFTIERRDKAKYYAPVVDIPVSNFMRFMPYELLSFRKLFQKHGEKAQFKHLENIDVDLYDEMHEILTEFLYSNAGTQEEREDRANRMMGAYCDYQNSKRTRSDAKIMKMIIDKICPFDLSDYKVIFPDELKQDVLNDDYINWIAIENEQYIDN